MDEYTQQLLLNAARAAGYRIQFRFTLLGQPVCYRNNRPWNPTVNKSDAIQLLVDIGADLMQNLSDGVAVCIDAESFCFEYYEDHRGNKMVATCWAITRAAAKMIIDEYGIQCRKEIS